MEELRNKRDVNMGLIRRLGDVVKKQEIKFGNGNDNEIFLLYSPPQLSPFRKSFWLYLFLWI
ncbi:hypothetical protein V6Z12_A09G250100 [Gossypium hirsutum]